MNRVSFLCLILTLAATEAHANDWRSATNAAAPLQLASVNAGATPAVQIAERPDFFRITSQDVAQEIARQLELQAVETKAEVNLTAGTGGTLYSADHPLQFVIHALQIDPDSRRWQAQVHIMASGKTLSVKPVSGTYVAMVMVPILKHQVSRGQIIEAEDITTRAMPQRTIRKDTILEPAALIGQSPRATITGNRPIRSAEISAPRVITKGQPVELTYNTAYMQLRVTGIALQDGAIGDMVRVKNDKSEKAVSGRVASAGRVDVNLSPQEQL